MTARQVQDLAASQVLPPNASRPQILESVARIVEGKGGVYQTLQNVEWVSESKLRATPIKGTVLQLVHDAAIFAGIIPVEAQGERATVGKLMNSPLNFTQTELNDLACYCHNGATMSAETAAKRLRMIASPDYNALRTDGH